MEKIEMQKAAAFISGGKDSMYALYKAISQGVHVDYLVTYEETSAHDYRPSPHTLNTKLLDLISESAGIPLVRVEEASLLKETLGKLGVDSLIGGDLALEMHKKWLEKICNDIGIKCYEPLWRMGSEALLNEMLAAGFHSVFIGVLTEYFDESWLGRTLDRGAVQELVEMSKTQGIDVCGENGEYHMAVLDCPLFKSRISILKSEKKQIEDFYCLLIGEAELVKKP